MNEKAAFKQREWCKKWFFGYMFWLCRTEEWLRGARGDVMRK